MSKLTPYKGREVLTSRVSIKNAGDGLSKAMEVDPVELSHDTVVHIVLEGTVTKHIYEEIKDTSALTLVHEIKAGRATLIDAEVVGKFLDDQEARIADAEGEPQLGFIDEPDEGDEDGFGLDDVDGEK